MGSFQLGTWIYYVYILQLLKTTYDFQRLQMLSLIACFPIYDSPSLEDTLMMVKKILLRVIQTKTA